MVCLDSRGLLISTVSDLAAERCREGVDLLLSTWPGAAEVSEAIAAAPDFALAHADTWPRDILILSLALDAFGLLAPSGRVDHDHAHVNPCERHAAHFAADDWWFLTYRGWSHAENGAVAYGRDLTQRAYDLRRNNANAVHALSHAMDEGGAGADADKLIADWLPSYDRSGILHGHIAWHAALAALEHGTTERAPAIYGEHVQPSASLGTPVNVIPVAADAIRIGGRDAQHEIVENMLLPALMRSGEGIKAGKLLDRRLHRHPSPRDTCWHGLLAA